MEIRLGTVLGWLLGAAVIVGGMAVVWMVQRAREAAVASAAQGPLNQLALALHNYPDVHGCLPPAWIEDARGKRLHSWRVLILPYVDENDLYQQYDFREPWDGPHNRTLADRMPRIFHSPSEPPSTRFANMVAIAGLPHLQTLGETRHLDLRRTAVSEGGVKRLQAVLPGTKITH